MHDEGLALLLLLGAGVARRTHQDDAFRALRAYFLRNWHRPAGGERH